MQTVHLVQFEPDLYKEPYCEAIWVITDYSDPPCESDNCNEECEGPHPYNCIICGKPIYSAHFVCLDDGSDSCHISCIEF